MSQTVPAVFRCPDHHRELTAEVIAEVEASGFVTAGGGMRRGPAAGPQPFKVFVMCPDDDGHELVFYGTYRVTT